MTAAVIKFDPLANAVWPAAQDDHFFAVGWGGLALGLAKGRGLICRVHIRCLCIKFRGASINPFELGHNTQSRARIAHSRFTLTRQGRKPRVGKAHHFQMAQAICVRW